MTTMLGTAARHRHGDGWCLGGVSSYTIHRLPRSQCSQYSQDSVTTGPVVQGTITAAPRDPGWPTRGPTGYHRPDVTGRPGAGASGTGSRLTWEGFSWTRTWRGRSSTSPGAWWL